MVKRENNSYHLPLRLGKLKDKGQVKIQQMAFMLIALTIFFVLVGLFVLGFNLSKIKGTANELENKNALFLASKLANSPEFSCGNSFGNNKLSCIDLDKVMALKENIEDYDRFWDVANIEIQKIYPVEEEIICTKGNYPNCNFIKLREKELSGVDLYNFVSLCHKEKQGENFYDKCEIGRLMVFYEKN